MWICEGCLIANAMDQRAPHDSVAHMPLWLTRMVISVNAMACKPAARLICCALTSMCARVWLSLGLGIGGLVVAGVVVGVVVVVVAMIEVAVFVAVAVVAVCCGVLRCVVVCGGV